MFFKTGKGEYGEGDQFCGITVPELRKIAKRYLHLGLTDLKQLLGSRLHEHRVTALEILVFQYEAADESRKQKLFDFYLRHTRYINNWDLVDGSAPYIVGEHLVSRPRKILSRLAKSPMGASNRHSRDARVHQERGPAGHVRCGRSLAER